MNSIVHGRLLKAQPFDRGRTDLHHVGWFDLALICLFLIGIYTNYTIQISDKLPFPSAPSGVAGMILFWRRRHLITPAHVGCLAALVFLYLITILCATNMTFLPRRTRGLIQLTYSIIIGYVLFLTVIQANRRRSPDCSWAFPS